MSSKQKFIAKRTLILYDAGGGRTLNAGDIFESHECNIKHLLHSGDVDFYIVKKPSKSEKDEGDK